MIDMIETEACAVAEYSATEAGLQSLRARLSNVAYDLTTAKGMGVAVQDRAEVRKLRTGLERMRTEIKAPALERCRLIDAEAKRITAELYALEQPIDAQIKAEEDRKAAERARREQAERERVAACMEAIEAIHMEAHVAVGQSPEEVRWLLEHVKAIDIDDRFQEYKAAAAKAKADTTLKLEGILSAALAQEAAAAQMAALRAENERMAAQLAEAQRIVAEAAQAADRQRAEADAIAAAARQVEEDRRAAANAEADVAAEIERRQEESAQAAMKRVQDATPDDVVADAYAPADDEEPSLIRRAVSTGVLHPTPEPLEQEAPAVDPVAALLAHINAAFDTKFPSHPKPSTEWWATLRRLADGVAL